MATTAAERSVDFISIESLGKYEGVSDYGGGAPKYVTVVRI
jgi:hypothetical protein